MQLQNQPTAAPTRKVKGAGTAGALTLVVLVVLEGAGIDVPGFEPSNIGELLVTALTGLGALVGGYVTRERG